MERPIGCYHKHKLDAENFSPSICETIEKIGVYKKIEKNKKNCVDLMLCIS